MISHVLGLFIPDEKNPHIWETTTDYYIHHSLSMRKKQQRPYPLTQWWDPDILQFLPRYPFFPSYIVVSMNIFLNHGTQNTLIVGLMKKCLRKVQNL